MLNVDKQEPIKFPIQFCKVGNQNTVLMIKNSVVFTVKRIQEDYNTTTWPGAHTIGINHHKTELTDEIQLYAPTRHRGIGTAGSARTS